MKSPSHSLATMTDHLKDVTEEGNFRAKIEAILKSAQIFGYHFIVHDALRTVEEQREKVAKGFSKTMRSKHLPGPDGKSRAVDVVDAKHGWGCPKHHWVLLGRLALTQGCAWGGLWGLPFGVRRKFEAYLLDRTKKFDPFEWKGAIGWDPAHIERK